MKLNRGIRPCEILLPAHSRDFAGWAVIACDQYTSQRSYWDKVALLTRGKPTTLNITQPEIDLDKAEARLPFVRQKMQEYLSDGTLAPAVKNGFVLTRRTTFSGDRIGLVGAVDLDAYEFKPGTAKPVRASEGTIIERLPPRIRIREGAQIECPHIMLLIDDPKMSLIEPVYESVLQKTPLYDFDLMLNGGHLTGWGVEDEEVLEGIDKAIEALFVASNGFLAAVGDGNHSLATAKACWEQIKPTLSEKERLTHPARMALVEIVNLHCEALKFKPIHRAVFGASMDELIDSFSNWLSKRNLDLYEGGHLRFTDGDSEKAYGIRGGENVLDCVYLQPWLDEYIKANQAKSVDYIHGDEALKEICRANKCGGIMPGTIDKAALFPSILAGGVLPRKSFSMGEADEKRFYMEARRIK